ncbi:MAG TPA: peptidoglycan-binding protein [Polyangia bacterium]|jgi:hypothetical protein
MDTLAKAQLRQLKPDFSDEDPDPEAKKKTVVVQFNPETLKVSYQNQIQQPEGGGDKRGSQSQLFVGSGTTKLTCTLWFDVNAPQPQQADPAFNNVDDVRKLTGLVSYFITPAPDKKDPKKFVPPAVRFAWGSFQFDGIVESVEESLEYFSPEGKPLRASVGIALSQQKILILPPKDIGKTNRPAPGTKPTTPVPQGSSVQKMAGENWQGVAQSNNVENPRLPSVGVRLDLQVG